MLHADLPHKGITRASCRHARLLTDNHLAPSEEYGLVVESPLTFAPILRSLPLTDRWAGGTISELMSLGNLPVWCRYLLGSWLGSSNLLLQTSVRIQASAKGTEIKRIPVMPQAVAAIHPIFQRAKAWCSFPHKTGLRPACYYELKGADNSSFPHFHKFCRLEVDRVAEQAVGCCN